jgi:hypothetical protein
MFQNSFQDIGWKKLRLAVWPILFLALGCNPTAVQDPQTTMETAGSDNLEAQPEQTPKRKPDFEVRFTLSSGKASAGLRLTASLVEFSVKSCASGYTMTGLGSSQDSFQLYRYDQSCKVWIESFTFDGQIFTPMPGQPFNPNAGQESHFIAPDGRTLIVRVLQQLPHILDTLTATASFMIVENAAGSDFNIQVYAVGVTSSGSVLVESPSSTVPVVIRRGLPAQGTLRVGLAISGTAASVADIVGIPAEVEFQDGVSEITLNVRALPDDPFDDLETLEISILPGAYFIADPSITLSVRDQSYRPPVWTQTAGSQTVPDDVTLSFSVAANDPDADPIYYSIDATRSTCTTGWLTPLSIDAFGAITGVPGDAAIGNCLLAITATSLGGQISQDISITVTDRPENPVWTQLPAPVRIFEGESLDVTFLAVDPDPGSLVSYSLDPASSCFGFAWSPVATIGGATGRLQGRPATASSGRCTFTVRAQSQGATITTDYQVEIARRTLVWSAPSGVSTNLCVPVSLLMNDGLDQFIDAPVTSTINLVINNGTGSFHTASSCNAGSAITSISWPVGASELNFYMKGTTANQNLTLVARGGTYEPGYANVSVTATPSRLGLTGPMQPVVNQCVKYRVDQLSSTNVKVVTASVRTVSFTLGAGMRAFRDALCAEQITSTTIPAYQSGQDFYIVPSSTGNRDIRATASGLTQALVTVQVQATRSWWNSSWLHRLPIQVDNRDQTVAFTNQPVLIMLTPDRFPYSMARSDGGDLRFVNSADNTVLPYQIEQWVPGGTSWVWVRVNQIAASSSLGLIHLYFGNAGATEAEQPSTLWADYAGIWHLSESPLAAAPQFKDSTTNARHGRAMSNPQSQQSPVAHGVSFMGTLDHIEITGFDLAPLLGRTATFSAWVKTTQVGGTIGWSSPSLTGVEANGTTNDIQYGWLDNTGRLGVTAGDSGAAKSSFVVNDSAWRHVTITRNESNGAVAFYVNGVASGTGTSESGFKSTSFNRFGVLWDTSGTHRDFNGFMDEIRIYSGVMSADRIRADYKYMVGTHLTYQTVEDY